MANGNGTARADRDSAEWPDRHPAATTKGSRSVGTDPCRAADPTRAYSPKRSHVHTTARACGVRAPARSGHANSLSASGVDAAERADRHAAGAAGLHRRPPRSDVSAPLHAAGTVAIRSRREPSPRPTGHRAAGADRKTSSRRYSESSGRFAVTVDCQKKHRAKNVKRKSHGFLPFMVHRLSGSITCLS